LLIPGAGRAQEAPGFSTFEIDLWPEYDRPEMLVIYKGVLSSEVTLPVTLTFRIPVEAGSPTAVAVGADPGSVADVLHTSQAAGDWQEISFVAAMPAIQFEYYDPNLKKEGSQRTFEYTWPGDHAAQRLTLQIQHPVGSSGMTITPSTGRIEQGGDGFTYNTIDLGELTAGSTFTVKASYQKTSDSLSVQTLEIQPSAPITPQPSGRLAMREVWPWLLGLLGVLLIAGGGLWYWRSGLEESAQRVRHRRRAPAGESLTTGSTQAIYCHQCGKRASPGDRFCRACGTRLRLE
jgi:hypothetical protein